MDGLLFFFVWTLFDFWTGFFIHWLATHQQRRLLKLFRHQRQVLRNGSRPVEQEMDMTTSSIETSAHIIEVSEGWLTIDTKRFPDDCISLHPDEVEELLKLLLISRTHQARSPHGTTG